LACRPAQWADPRLLAERIRSGALAGVHSSEVVTDLAEHLIARLNARTAAESDT
jgi:hypothetical protein